MFTTGIINDEVSQDIQTVCAFAKRSEIRALEIRSVEGKSLSQLTAKDARNIQKIIRDAGFSDGAYEAGAESLPALRGMIEAAQKEG